MDGISEVQIDAWVKLVTEPEFYMHWRLFAGSSTGPAYPSRYYSGDRTWKGDVEQLHDDLLRHYPLAIEMMRRYIVWATKRRMSST